MLGQLKWAFVSAIVAAIIIGSLKLRLDEVKARFAAAQMQIIALENQIKDQNTAISQWQAQATVAQQRLTDAESKAKKQETRISKDEQKILNQKVSPGCDAAVRWGAAEAKRLGNQW